MDGIFDITIVGNGASGTATLIQLLKESSGLPEISICLIGKINSLGKGDAFADNNEFLIMNMPSRDLSIVADKPNHFIDWFNRQKGFSITDDYFPKRLEFAEYIEDTVKSLISWSASINVCMMNNIALDIEYIKATRIYDIITDSISNVTSRYVIVATGNPAQENHYLKQNARNYIQNPYPLNIALNQIKDNTAVAIIGSSLSAVDAAIYLSHKNKHNKIYMISRKGKLPTVKGVVAAYKPRHCTQKKIMATYVNNGHKKLSAYQIARIVRSEFRINSIDWRFLTKFGSGDIKESLENARNSCLRTNILMAIQFELDRAWRYVDEKVLSWIVDKKISQILHRIAPIPIINAQKIARMINTGALEVLSGIEEIIPGQSHKVITSEKDIEVDYIVNATGPSRRATIESNLFLKNLVKKGYAQKHPSGGIATCPFNGKLRGKFPNLYSIGYPTFNQNPLINNIRLITHNAHDLAMAVIEEI